MFRRICAWSLMTCAALCAAEPGQEVRLWTGDAVGSEGVTAPEVSQPSTKGSKLPSRFTVVHYPSVFVFLPPKEKANGTALIVAPGGGHSQLVIEHEGWQIAEWANQQGMAAFVLKYRLARAKDSKYTAADHAWADAARAIRTVRARASEWSVKPDRIGIIGFSAGGEVAALAETKFDEGNGGSSDPVERVSSRPDFAVVVYPGYRPGAVTVPKNAPPTFLVCADDDRSHVVTTVNLYLDLQKQGVPSEMHIYTAGGHGFGMRPLKVPRAPGTRGCWNG
jgi:endo-1,4-beta-xylanase